MKDFELEKLMGNAEDVVCECGCKYFERADSFKRISKIIALTPKDLILVRPVIICKKCGLENDYLMELMSENEE
jgi:hypothetical protein